MPDPIADCCAPNRSARLARWFVLGLAAVILVMAFRRALEYSGDLQWSGARLLAAGLNPYAVALGPEAGKWIDQSQWPNYPQALYLLLLPLGFLNAFHAAAVFAAFNGLLALICPWLAARLFSLDYNRTTVLLLIWFVSAPMRTVIGNGQTSLFVLVGILLAALGVRPGWGISLSYLKFSFAVPFGVTLFRLHGWRSLMVSFIPVVSGALIFALLFRDPIVFLQPIQVGSRYVGWGTGDLAEVTFLALPQLSSEARLGIRLLLALACGVATWWCLDRLRDERASWVAAGLLSLIFFTHLYYDYVLLLPYVAWLLCRSRTPRQWKLGALPILYAWLFYGRVYFLTNRTIATWLMLVCLVVMLWLVLAAARPDAVDRRRLDPCSSSS